MNYDEVGVEEVIVDIKEPEIKENAFELRFDESPITNELKNNNQFVSMSVKQGN